MNLDFIVVSLPRSCSTWTANWLTTDQSICWHDATGYALPPDLDEMPSEKQYRGISCTGAWMWDEWFENHPARKLILERDTNEINESLEALGLPPMPEYYLDRFARLKGRRIHFSELFTNPKGIWEHLLPDLPFDTERHTELAKMNIQPIESVIVPDAEYIRKALADLNARLNNA